MITIPLNLFWISTKKQTAKPSSKRLGITSPAGFWGRRSPRWCSEFASGEDLLKIGLDIGGGQFTLGQYLLSGNSQQRPEWKHSGFCFVPTQKSPLQKVDLAIRLAVFCFPLAKLFLTEFRENGKVTPCLFPFRDKPTQRH